VASIAAQLESARVSARAAASFEAINRSRIEQLFADWDAGLISNRQIRHRLENVVRGGYRASGATAREHTRRASELPDWVPANQTFLTPYLNSLLADVRRNLREYAAVRTRRSSSADDVEKARRRALLRIKHSAGVATTRGYTDGLIQAHVELEDLGFKVVKVWMANFENNTPCRYCRALHGTQRGLQETFQVQVKEGTRLAIYRDLQGPPRHPQCQCYLAILIITLENAFEPINVDAPADPEDETSAAAVRNLPLAVFRAIIAALRAIARFTRGE
jgi:hypothetical protein